MYLEEEQKGCIKKKLGAKHQLLINKAILEDCRKRQRNLSMAWIDYKKAFDSVPHSWIMRCLELYKIDEEIRSFLSNQILKWKTTITLNHTEGQIVIPDIKIQRGIFQGDSLSPLLFCLTLDPLSKILKSFDMGYSMSRDRSRKSNDNKINHLLFMDDLKLYAESEEKLDQLINAVYEFSADIGMDFGLDKCSKCTIRKGKKVAANNIQLNEGTIEDLAQDTTYKYLGIEENATIEHKKMNSQQI